MPLLLRGKGREKKTTLSLTLEVSVPYAHLVHSKLSMATLSLTLFSSASVEKPRPYTVLARMSDHWPNFCEVLVNIMLGVMVLLITAWKEQEMNIQSNTNFLLVNSTSGTGDKLSSTGGRPDREDTQNRRAASLEDKLL